MSTHSFKKGDRVKVYNGGKLEGWAIINRLCDTEDDYLVHFEEDMEPRISGGKPPSYRRTVMPEWQSPDYAPLAPEPAICPEPRGRTNTDLDASSTTVCDACGDESNSAPGLTCGRMIFERDSDEGGSLYCSGTYRTREWLAAQQERVAARMAEMDVYTR